MKNKMKKNKSIIYFFLTILSVWIISCTSMDEYSKFQEGGEIRYAGKVKDVFVYTGKNRIKLEMELGVDPFVSKVVVYWNDRNDSVEVLNVNPNQSSNVEVVIDGLAEKAYNFELVTYDADGNFSISTYASGVVYGSLYEENLLNRSKKSAVCGVISWGKVPEGALGVEVTYTNSEGVEKTVIVQNSEVQTMIEDANDGTEFQYRTIYMPDSLSLDTFYASNESAVFGNTILGAGQYEVTTEVEWPHVATGGVQDVIQISDTQFSFYIANATNNNVPIVVDVDFSTNKTSVAVQQFGDFGDPYFMTAESVESDDNYVSPCDGIISIRVYITNLERKTWWGERTITLKRI